MPITRRPLGDGDHPLLPRLVARDALGPRLRRLGGGLGGVGGERDGVPVSASRRSSRSAAASTSVAARMVISPWGAWIISFIYPSPSCF
jgi:hypothetical protein